ncbi:MAG: cobyrinate a,c-diamide synthase [Synergistaceae bacterium]|jgi:cobyrinic acid a,c-diamide synthase|nr:cobyrinate a,c-diamide synthase [Synergistaceae bacterium]
MTRFSNTKGFILGAVSSGAGKTAAASAICRLLSESGMTVQPFKTGPDFIDTSYLAISSGRTCRNLDGFPCPELMPFFYAESCGYAPAADIAVIEGVMGLYDGLGPDGEYSTAWLARNLDLPVVLLVDARSAATSVAAVAKGFADLKPLAPRIAGVIANRVSGEHHAELIREALGRFTGLPLLGWLPNIKDDSFPSRHLGLVPASEHKSSAATIDNYARALREHLDADLLRAIAGAPSGQYIEPKIPPPIRKPDGAPVRAAVADDDAFCFHYRENWRLLERLGAEIKTISPIRGNGVPEDTDLLILPGGYPEEFSAELSGNAEFMKSVSNFTREGCVYAECGGMLYLSRSMSYRGQERAMTGVIEADVKMTGRLSRFGYVEGTALRDNLLMRSGESVRAHEFHYSRLDGREPDAYSVKKFSRPGETWTDGYVMEDGRLLASYLHINFYSRPESAERMLKRAACKTRPRREEVE